MRTEDEINDQIDAAMAQMDEGGSRWPGMTYEQGVEAALRWAVGDEEMPPMDEE